MKLFNTIKSLFEKKISQYGPRIFEQQTWLDKKVNEQLLKQQVEIDLIRRK